MPTAKLFLSGIRAEGRHGARPGEKDQPQPFVVDLDLDVDTTRKPTGSTRPRTTVGIRDAVRAVVEEGSFDLIEVMARHVAAAVLSLDHVTRVTAVVHKPGAAARLDIDGVAAAVTLEG